MIKNPTFKMPLLKLKDGICRFKIHFFAFFAMMLFAINVSAHTWEIRVKQNANGTLTWYGQTYHGVGECGIANSGININGVNYNWTAEFSGSVVPLSAYIFTASPTFVGARNAYATVTTAFIPGNLIVTAYSNNVCYALWSDMPPGGGTFNPPPPACTTCPLISWTNSAGTPNNNGTPCNVADDFIPVTITVNHQNCAKSTGNGQFTVFNSSTNTTVGSYVFNGTSPTIITYNAPVGTSNSTQLNISTTFPCNVQQSLVAIPNGSFSGIPETTPPSITCPANINIIATSASGAVVNYTPPVGTDNCPGLSTVRTAGLASGSTFPIGTTTVTYKVTDAVGLTAVCSFTVTVTCTAPAITNCPFTGYSQIYADQNNCSAAFSYSLNITGSPAPVVTYTLSGATTASGSGTGSGSTFNVGQTTVTVTATNACGTATCSFVITVIDNVVPVAICKPITVYLGANGTVSISPSDINNGSYDNCGAVTLSFNSGTICGTAVENQNATLTAPAGLLINNIDFASYGTPNGTCGNFTIGSCHATNSITKLSPYLLGNNSGTVPATNGLFGDPCGGTVKRLYIQAHYGTTSSTSNTFNCSNVGNNNVTLVVTDVNGNVSTCTAVVTVIDNILPVITCPVNVTVNCQANNTSAATGVATATDNCPSVAITQSQTSTKHTDPLNAGYYNYVITRTWRATDASNNFSECVQTITVQDITAPMITCPAAVSATTNTGCTATGVNLGTPTTADNCSVASVTNDAPAAFPLGATTVTWTVTDGSSNTATCTQIVTVTDNVNPTITCPAAVSATTNTGCTATGVNLGTPVTNDNCSVASVTNNAPAAFPLGATTVTWTVTDGSSNTATCTQIVTVTDNENPTINCPAPIAVNTDLGVCGATVTYTVTSADNCPGQAVTQTAGLASGSVFPVGVTTNSFLVTDASGNTATCSFTVTVTDNEAPSITCAAAQTQTADEGVCNAAVTVVGPATGDNCGVASVINSHNNTADASGTYPVGTTTVTWTVTDIHGNTNTCTQDITVTDNEAPSITCAAAQTQTADAGVCNAAVTVVGPATGDNCGVASVKNSYNNTANASGTYPVGTTVVTWTVTDIHGNSNTCTQSITVTDNEKPVISVQNIARCFADDNFGSSIDLGVTPTDNCGIASQSNDAPSTFPVGTTTVTWTATDIHGNVSTATQLVTRNPEININICAGPTSTIYTGTTSGVGPFGPQSVNLSSVVTGGTPGYSYKWTPSTGLNNAMIANPVARPTVTTVYTLTVTDSKGCKRSLSITINVLPLSAAVCSGSGNNVKFLVCHIPPGNPSNPQNICISVNALNAHLTSGSNGHNNCYLGPCQQNCFSTIPGAASLITSTQTVEEVIVLEAPIVEVQQPEFKVNVYPNPTAYDFSIQVLSKSNEPITVRILDVNGKVISVGNTFLKGNNIKAGANLPGGTYIAEVTQGTNRKTVKLVKLN